MEIVDATPSIPCLKLTSSPLPLLHPPNAIASDFVESVAKACAMKLSHGVCSEYFFFSFTTFFFLELTAVFLFYFAMYLSLTHPQTLCICLNKPYDILRHINNSINIICFGDILPRVF